MILPPEAGMDLRRRPRELFAAHGYHHGSIGGS
jgi:hypothetical protein